ncbi:MAG: TRAP transporter small permease subunit [Myxococcales bacterium]|nr:TRAP transporter small permease subunit [Myxococcales bacterium]MDH3485303.1 TRAP transporter small permease subunit [Myxococcales bacterium]
MKYVRRLDRQLARGEAAVAATVLLLMIVIAAAQATLRNLTNFDLDFANVMLERMAWADSFLQKGTLWLAFFGASLSTYDEKHIAIDVLPRLSPPRMKQFLRAIVSTFGSVTCFYLGRVFWLSVLNNAMEVPLEYSLLGPEDEMIHVCQASAQALADAGLSRPGIFCGIRNMLGVFGAEMSTPDVALQLIVPSMFIFMSVRFLLRAIAAGVAFVTKNYPDSAEGKI